jgi:peptidoglycan/LPS O-acetylase OafA/YrhL
MEERKAELHHIPDLDGVRGIAILAVLLLHSHDPFQATRPLGWIGRINYGAYVYHGIPDNYCGNFSQFLGRHYTFMKAHTGVAANRIGLFCTILFVWLSSRFFESQFLNLKEHWTVRAAS